MGNPKMRTEEDLLGSMQIPMDHLYGIQTQRAMDNFQFSPYKLSTYPRFIEAMAITKKAAAMANHELNELPEDVYKAMCQACDEIREGELRDQFCIDMFQGGAGTSANMNANEVIANRALEILGYEHGDYKHCDPHDHVNLSQSTNDAYPTFAHIGLYLTFLDLTPHLDELIKSLRKKAKEFRGMLKIGRTQLQDAVPMTHEQTFNGFASILEEEIPNLEHAAKQFLVLNMGSTAIGTGICSQPGYREAVIKAFRKITEWDIKPTKDYVGATSDTSHMVGYSAALKRLAVKLSKISNDLRLLSSGPFAGLGDITLPARQPGSSIMPGKVNPVIPEVITQIAMKVIGNDVCVTMAGEAAQLELNAMEPIMVQCCFESSNLLMRAMDTLREFCIDGIKANAEHTRKQVYDSLSIVTALNPYIGYDNSTHLTQEAQASGRSIVDLVLEKGILSKEQLDEILDPDNLTQPVRLDIKPLKSVE